jgi:asparagine synthase (glutamine-hydrolysing)
MCGIFGIAHKSGGAMDPALLWNATQKVAYRGPDDWGFAAFAPLRSGNPRAKTWSRRGDGPPNHTYQVGLGHRRLSILDLSEAGHQPMNLAGTDLWIIFNGEIYNYIELKAELGNSRSYKTGTDTEVLLAAYDKWGTDCLSRLNGMFSFCIWDGRHKKLLLARDRFGEKPLYYAFSGDRLLFGSELKQFLEFPDFNRTVDATALADCLLLTIQDHNERTFLAEARQLLAGHFLEFDLASGTLSEPRRYWLPDVVDDFDTANDKGFDEQLRFLLSDSIRMRLRSDVRVGVCLSGGLDSSSICSLAASQINRPAHLSAYSIVFPGHPEDEDALATECATRAGARHVKATISGNALWSEMRDFAFHQDGPAGGPAIFGSWSVFKLAHSDGAAVLLNGNGGDELLAGYNKFFMFWFQILSANRQWARLLGESVSYLRHQRLDNFNVTKGRRYFPNALRQRLNGMWRFSLPGFAADPSTSAGMGSGTSINQRLWLDLTRYSLPRILHWEDRNSMAVSTESRLPFLDHRIVELALSTSVSTKLHRGYTKYGLRSAMNDILPPSICWNHIKKGFATPGKVWFSDTLVQQMRELLSRNDNHLAEFLDFGAMRSHYEAFCRGDRNTLSDSDWFQILATSLWMEGLEAPVERTASIV